MAIESNAKQRFARVKRAVARLHEVQLMIMNGCDEWRPPSVSSRSTLPDPTANAAIRHVDEIDGRLRSLRDEEAELVEFIGEALVIVQAVRDGLGGKYADVLEWRYVDCLTWDYIKAEFDVSRRTVRDRESVAFDWIDSIGITRIIAGDLEL